LDNYQFSEGSSANVIPADPSSIQQVQNSDNNFIENEFSVNLLPQQSNLSFNDPLISSFAISRYVNIF
jgi:hypothetical protein